MLIQKGTVKVRLRVGDRELEVEGPEASVEKHVEAWAKRLNLERAPIPGFGMTAGQAEPDIQALARRIHEDGRWELIYDRILRQRPALPCELVPLYYEPGGLTASQVSEVLRALGRILKANNVIRDLPSRGREYVTRTRSPRGTIFMLNPTGRAYIEGLLK
jgi:hypothetical protein